jgi:hypothetical protein
LTVVRHRQHHLNPDGGDMRNLDTLSLELSRAQARLVSGFHQHVAIALTACLLGLLLG